MLEQLDRERALTDLRRFSGEAPICREENCVTITNRLTCGEGLRQVEQYVSDELSRAGYSPEFEEWTLAGHQDRNVIARKVGATLPQEEVYVVAHIDGVGNGSTTRFPAADDNASGAAAVLELARVAASHTFDRTIVFFFSTGEEQGELGVKSHLEKMTWADLAPIKAVINVDMIGYDANGDGKMELWRGYQVLSMDLSNQVAGIIGAYPIRLVPEVLPGCF